MTTLNRLANCKNRFQGERKKVLCVCAAGLLRSPTAAFVLSNPPFDYNTRSAGLDEEFALIPVDDVLLEWADLIVCMTSEQASELRERTEKTVVCLNIPDKYSFRDPELEDLIKTACMCTSMD